MGTGLQRVSCLCFQSCSVESAASLTSTSSGGWRPFSAGRNHRKGALGGLVSSPSALAGGVVGAGKVGGSVCSKPGGEKMK